GRDNRLGTVIPLAEIGTDPERANAWTREAADSANRAVRRGAGISRTPMTKPEPGYIALQLDGLWLRGLYLHNGSVPTVRALLEAPEDRPRAFYRGYDVLDRRNLGFVSLRCRDDRAELPGVFPEAGGYGGRPAASPVSPDPGASGQTSGPGQATSARSPAGSARTAFQWGCMPSHEGWLLDTSERGNGNGGHVYGVDLSDELKAALVEYLKTF
ncbi:MAG TPA: hypothetical protein VE173_01440, partial [Longimicrobiales bacterium]|nr:hypothetical protein [Longimicrobiales bacterium]